MILFQYLWWFFGGTFLGNSIPHIVNGVSGRPFQTPFAKPPGKGLSTSTVNVLWGFFNAATGWLLIFRVGQFNLHAIPDVASVGLGMLLISNVAARTFGRLHGGNLDNRISGSGTSRPG